MFMNKDMEQKGVLLLDLFEFLNANNLARGSTVHQPGGLVVVFASPLNFPPMLGYFVLEIDHLAVNIYAWTCVDLQSLKDPVLILLGFLLLVSFSLGRVLVMTVFLPVVSTFTAVVFPFGAIANAENILPESLVLAQATPSLSFSYSTSLFSIASSLS